MSERKKKSEVGSPKSDEAWQYTVLYNHLNDSLQARASAFIVASYENEQKDNEQNKKLILFRQQHAVQEATISQRNTINGYP